MSKNNKDSMEAETTAHAQEKTYTPKRSNKKAFRVVAIIAAALFVIFLFTVIPNWIHGHNLKSEASDRENAIPEIQVVNAIPASAVQHLKLPGEARAWLSATVFARTSGYLKTWNVDIGDKVSEGQSLATIESPELDQQAAEAQAKLEVAKAEAQVSDSELEFAKISSKRWQNGATQGVVSAQERDEKLAGLQSSNAKNLAAKSQVDLAASELDRLKVLQSFTNVIAPFSGIVTERHVDIGDLVSAGSTSSTTPLFRVDQSDKIRVFVEVPQSASAQITVGMLATVTAKEFPNRNFSGSVSRTANSLNPHSRTLTVEVLVPNEDLSLRPGMYTTVNFNVHRLNPVVKIRASALVMRPDGPNVLVVTPDNKATFQKITIERDMGDFIEVSSGIKGGDVVALNVANTIVSGQTVQPEPYDESSSDSLSSNSKTDSASGGK